MKTTILTTALLLLSLPAAAQQQTTENRVFVTGDEDIGDISGESGSKTGFVRLTIDDGSNRINTIFFSEQSDRPCEILVIGPSDSRRSTFNACVGASANSKSLSPDPGVFSGLQVCQNAQKDRIKGVRLFVSEYEKDGEKPQSLLVRKAKLMQEMSRTNCDEKNGWAAERRCPIGSMLTGFKVFYRTGEGVGNTSDVITGLAPICRSSVIRFTKKTTGTAYEPAFNPEKK